MLLLSMLVSGWGRGRIAAVGWTGVGGGDVVRGALQQKRVVAFDAGEQVGAGNHCSGVLWLGQDGSGGGGRRVRRMLEGKRVVAFDAGKRMGEDGSCSGGLGESRPRQEGGAGGKACRCLKHQRTLTNERLVTV